MAPEKKTRRSIFAKAKSPDKSTVNFVFTGGQNMPEGSGRHVINADTRDNSEETMRESHSTLETLKNHYELSSLTINVPRRFLGVILSVIIVVVWEALARSDALSADRFPAPSVIIGALLELLRGNM